MPRIEISDEMFTRVAEFKHVIETVIEEEISFDTCVEVILGQGIDTMLDELLDFSEPDTLLRSFQQIGSQYPAQVYGYVVETLKRGGEIRANEEAKRRLGFRLTSMREDGPT